jgi:hypothetical protein
MKTNSINSELLLSTSTQNNINLSNNGGGSPVSINSPSSGLSHKLSSNKTFSPQNPRRNLNISVKVQQQPIVVVN